MASGKLRHPVTLMRRVTAEDRYGSPVEAWEDVFEAWAEIKPIRSSEFFAAQATNASLTHRVVMRCDDRVSDDMRVIYDGRVFEILGPPRIYFERGDKMELMCREVYRDR